MNDNSGASDYGLLREFVGFKSTPAATRAMRFIATSRGVRLSDVYRDAVHRYMVGALESLESEPVAGLAGQDTAELAAALRAAIR